MFGQHGDQPVIVERVDQRVEVGDRFDDDVAAAPAIAAIGPAEFDELLAAKAGRTRPAVAALQEDFCLVEKFHRCSIVIVGNKKGGM